ncbi:MAG: hypothetical protein ACXVC7_07660, partial [Bacteroidia bacterium]
MATTFGVIYTCNAGCTPSSFACNLPGTVWKKSNLYTNIWGIDFDRSDPTYKSLYCSWNQLYYTTDIENNGFVSLTNQIPGTTYAFDDLSNLPNGISFSPGAAASKKSTINIATNSQHPTKCFILMTFGNYGYPNQVYEESYFIVYDKTISPGSNYANFIVKNTQSTGTHPVRNYIHVDPGNSNMVAFTENGIFGAGVTFYDLATDAVINTASCPHNDGHDFAFSSMGGGSLIRMTDGGPVQIDLTSFAAQYIIGSGLGVAEISGFDIKQKTGSEAIIGLQDDGTKKATDLHAGNSWNFLWGSDGAPPVYLNDGNYYFGDAYGYYTSNIGSPFITPSIGNNTFDFYAEIELASNNLATYHAAKELIYNSWDWCAFPEQSPHILSDFNSYRNSLQCFYGAVHSFAASPDNSTIYVADYYREFWSPAICDKTNYTVLWKTTSGGINHPDVSNACNSPGTCWTPLATQNQLKLTGIASAVCINPSDPQQVWVASGGYWNQLQPANDRVIAFSSDGGTTWVDFSQNLPNMPVNKLIYRKGTNEIYAATDVGVYYTDVTTYSSTGWTKVGSVPVNLPNTVISDIKIDYCNNKLYAGTYGRGLWSIDLPSPINRVALPKTIITQTVNLNSSNYLPCPLTSNLPGKHYFQNDVVVTSGSKLII